VFLTSNSQIFKGKALSRSLCALVLGALCVLLTLSKPGWAQTSVSPDEALVTLLESARSDCNIVKKTDLLQTALCAKRIRFGVSAGYPGFGFKSDDDQWVGYETDVARRIAARFGVEAVFVTVTGSNRIPALAEGRVDVVLSTLGHTTLRDSEVTFVRPHYYASQTEIMGERNIRAVDWNGLTGRTVCVTVGSYQNAGLVGHGLRLMLFDGSTKLEEALDSGMCVLAAHDDSFFAGLYREPEFYEKFDTKFRFAPVPWGAAVPKNNAKDLALALGLLFQTMHRDGELLDLAQANRVNTDFLEGQRDTWKQDSCNRSTGNTNPDCILSPLNTVLTPTSFSGFVKELEASFSTFTGVDISFPWLTTVSGWTLFKSGVLSTFVLLIGSLFATLLIACLVGWTLSSPIRLLRWMTSLLVITVQSTPFVLGLVIGLVFATALFSYSIGLGLTVCIVVTGLMNGANAGQSIAESITSLRGESRDRSLGLFVEALRRSQVQIQAFLVNASKALPAASFIGAPELLSAMTDISSFSSSRLATYLFLMLFYMAIVFVVVWLCGKAGDWLEKGGARSEMRRE
jgi:ABC-type amino acid transport substrate-binding protein/ABC-type amino acid transport system permease subunit